MKHPQILLFTLLLALLTGCEGCNKSVNTEDNEVRFDSIQYQGTYHLFNDSTKPFCNLQINFLYPVDCADKKILKTLQSIFISKYFGNSFANKTPQEALDAYKTQYIDSYKQFELENEEESTDHELTDDNTHSSFSYFEVSHNEIYFNKGGILSFFVVYQNFTGGAHGSSKQNGYVIDLRTGRLITENDIFCEDCYDQISAVIAQKIAKQNNLSDPKELENNGFKGIDEMTLPNGNFLVNNEGILYIYNGDEIAPSVMGQTKVMLPYHEIKMFLNKKGALSKFAE